MSQWKEHAVVFDAKRRDTAILFVACFQSGDDPAGFITQAAHVIQWCVRTRDDKPAIARQKRRLGNKQMLQLIGGNAAGRDAIDQLMDPAMRAAMAPADLARLSQAIASSLTTVYVVVLVLAVVAFLLCFLVPAGQRTQRH